jgi:hypothetical protein
MANSATHNGDDSNHCSALTTHPPGRRDSCRSIANRARGTTTERGYGSDHRSLREQWKPAVLTGRRPCFFSPSPDPGPLSS